MDITTTPGSRRPATYWYVHVALVIGVAAVVILWGPGSAGLLRELDISLKVLIVLLFAGMFIASRRIGGAFGTPYALFTAGAACSLAHRFVTAELPGLALTILCVLFFLSGIVLIVPRIRRVRSSQ